MNLCYTKSMTRNERIRSQFDQTMRLIEIGPSYNPIVPKSQGWNTIVVDHTTKGELLDKYAPGSLVSEGFDASVIEEVDIVWRQGALSDCFPKVLHGQFDGLIASHVIEHVPDIISFLQSVAVLLKPNGKFFLAVPDKRLCFDFFVPLSTTGHAIDAVGQSRHTRGILFDHAAYYAFKGGEGAWQRDGKVAPFTFAHEWGPVSAILQKKIDDYEDAHKWRFIPASFQLMILELNRLKQIVWTVGRIEPQAAVEFWVWLQRGDVDHLSAEEFADQRMGWLKEGVVEMDEQISQLIPPTADDTKPPEPEYEYEDNKRIKLRPMPTISAIIPLYNGEKFIRESLTSVLTQTLPPLEIIVVNDGSADNGPKIVEEMARQYPEIVLLNKINGGQSSARNFGVAHSTGALIALLDQDDVWYPHHLEEMVRPFRKPEPGRELGWVYSDLDEVDDEGNMIHHKFLRTLPTPHPKSDLFVCLRENMFVLPSASLISRSAFNRVEGFDERLSGYEDDDLFLRLFRAGYANVFIEQALSKWRIYPDSSSYSYRMRRSRAVYFRKLWDNFEDDPNRARFIKRDLLLPRFYVEALNEYVKAVRKGDDKDLIEETREELLYVVTRWDNPRRQMFAKALTRMRSPKLADAAYKYRHLLRPITRRLI